jgi:hypothetical protein
MHRAVLVGAIVLAGSLAAGQEPHREQQLKNLQFFPESTTHDEIVPPMREMTAALGAKECEYCHVSGRGELDDKVQKRTARVMLRLTADLNAKLDAELGPAPGGKQRVGCVTCHRGEPIPRS